MTLQKNFNLVSFKGYVFQILGVVTSVILIIIIYTIFVFILPYLYSGYFYKTQAPKNLLEYNLQNPESENLNTLKVAVIGDSTAVGQGTDSDQKSFGFQYIQKYLLPNYQSIIYSNFGQSGDSTIHVLDNQISNLENQEYDIILISIGSNDVISTSTSKQQFVNNISKIADKLAKTKAKIIWLSIPDYATVPILLPPLKQFLSNRAREFNLESKQILDSNKIQLIDVYDSTRQPFIDNSNKYFSMDKYHPSIDGYGLWVEVINSQLK